MKNIEAIIFDLDGTLIDSVSDLAASVNFTLKSLGLAERSVEEIRSFVGDGVQKLIVRSLGDTHQDRKSDALKIFMQHYGEHLTDSTTLYDGVMSTLATLHADFHLAVLTNKSEGFSRKILHALGLAHYFEAVIGGDSLPVKKPDPAAVYYLAAKWNIRPDRMVMVGDHATDIQTGINAGCKTVFLTNGIGEARGLVPDFVIRGLAELPALVCVKKG